MRGSVTINPRGSNTSSNSGGGVRSYLELDDRLDSLIDVDVTNPSTSTPVSIDNPQAVGVSIDANAKTITSTVDGWGNSGVWDNLPRTGDFHVSGLSFSDSVWFTHLYSGSNTDLPLKTNFLYQLKQV
jgi:hypothetical protein